MTAERAGWVTRGAVQPMRSVDRPDREGIEREKGEDARRRVSAGAADATRGRAGG
jgi:hypothetical protein